MKIDLYAPVPGPHRLPYLASSMPALLVERRLAGMR